MSVKRYQDDKNNKMIIKEFRDLKEKKNQKAKEKTISYEITLKGNI